MDIDRMKALAGFKEAKKTQPSTLSVYDIDGITIGDLINHLQIHYNVNDRIAVEDEYNYSMVGGGSEPREVINIYSVDSK